MASQIAFLMLAWLSLTHQHIPACPDVCRTIAMALLGMMWWLCGFSDDIHDKLCSFGYVQSDRKHWQCCIASVAETHKYL